MSNILDAHFFFFFEIEQIEEVLFCCQRLTYKEAGKFKQTVCTLSREEGHCWLIKDIFEKLKHVDFLHSISIRVPLPNDAFLVEELIW